MELFKIENLSFKYAGADNYALSGINLTVNKGDFVLISGKSGGGKTTLLKMLKKELIPRGEKSGAIFFNSKNIDEQSLKNSAEQIGFVFQNPDEQTVMDGVRSELFFGLENLGVEKEKILRRVAEVCGFLGFKCDLDKKICELSGGEKQLLNLASVLSFNPDVLILDEPTAELDPVQAYSFLKTLKKLNDETGVTVIMSEHRLEDAFSMASKAVFIKDGKVALDLSPAAFNAGAVEGAAEEIFLSLPASVRLFCDTNGTGCVPLTVNEGKIYLENNFYNDKKRVAVKPDGVAEKEKIIQIENAGFRFSRGGKDVLNGLDLTVYKNEILSVFGGNGAGKTTLLKILGGIKSLYRGKYVLRGKSIKNYKQAELYENNVAVLPQNPAFLFVKDSVFSDLKNYAALAKLNKTDGDINAVLDYFGVPYLKNRHPFDLSGGEKQLAALAKILLSDPEILLLDEPTKGLDKVAKKCVGEAILHLKKSGKTVIIATHDIEFAAEYSDRCAMLFDGKIAAANSAKEFFTENAYYTTAAHRISRTYYDDAVTYFDLLNLARLNGKRN